MYQKRIVCRPALKLIKTMGLEHKKRCIYELQFSTNSSSQAGIGKMAFYEFEDGIYELQFSTNKQRGFT